MPEPRNHLKASPGNEVRRFFARAGRKELIGETVEDECRHPDSRDLSAYVTALKQRKKLPPESIRISGVPGHEPHKTPLLGIGSLTPSDSLVSRDCGLIVAQIAENLPRPVRGLPVAEDIDVRLSTDSGYRAASTWAIMPPMDIPAAWKVRMPSPEASPTTSEAISSSP